jgi:hypothetical protein
MLITKYTVPTNPPNFEMFLILRGLLHQFEFGLKKYGWKEQKQE